MIPEKILKKEKRDELVKKIETLADHGFSNIELGKLLGVHKARISGLRVKRGEYPISLSKIEPLLKKAEEVLSSIRNK